MKLFSTTRTKRNTAFFAMLVWLLALASGIANACQARAAAGHGHDADTLKAPCLKLCDDESRSLPKQESGAAQTDPGPAPLLVILWIAATEVGAPPARVEDRRPLAPGLPLRLRYVRLAL